MKPHKLIEPWKGDKRFTEMAKRAAALKKAGQDAEQIVAAIRAEFGPPHELERMRDAPQPFHVYGEIGADIEPSALAQLELALRLPIAVRGALMPDAPHRLRPADRRRLRGASRGGANDGRRGYRLPYAPIDLRHAARGAAAPPRRIVRRSPGHHGLWRWRQPPAPGRPRCARRRSLGAHQPDARAAREAAAQLGTSGSGNHFAELVVGERMSVEDGGWRIEDRQSIDPPISISNL